MSGRMIAKQGGTAGETMALVPTEAVVGHGSFLFSHFRKENHTYEQFNCSLQNLPGRE